MFKDAPQGTLLEAWCILRLAMGDLALFPRKVNEWIAEVTWRGLPMQTTCTFTKNADLQCNEWFCRDDDCSSWFYVAEAAKMGWKKYIGFDSTLWWPNEKTNIWFLEKM